MTYILAICKRNTFIAAVQPHLFDHGIEIVFVCNNPRDALTKYKSLQPHIVLMDANWLHPIYWMSGTELIQSLIDHDPAVRIIVTTTFHQPALLTLMKAIGIKGYFPKTSKNVLDEIITCIKTVHNGGEYFGVFGKELGTDFL